MTIDQRDSPIEPAVLVAGIGGIGGWVLARLAQHGADVTGWARGETYRQLAGGEPLILESHQGDWSGPVRVIDRPVRPFDLTFVCTKSHDTATVAKALPRGGKIVSVQNGVENVEVLASVGHDAVATVVRAGCRRIGPTTIRHTSNGFLVSDDRFVIRYLEHHGIECRIVPDVRIELWRKLVENVVANSLCAILRTPVGDVVQAPMLEPLMRAAVAETVAVAERDGVPVRDVTSDDVIASLRSLPPANRPSTLQDLERGGQLEVDALTGAVVRKAKDHGVGVPTVMVLDALLRFLAQQTPPA